MKQYKISNEFSDLKEFILKLPDTFDNMGSVIVNNRNIVKKVDTGQGTIIIKSFKGMYFFNRLAYSFLRKSKAERSYINSGILNDRGILTPPNVGWLDCYHWGLLGQSYYISAYSPYKTLKVVLKENMHNEAFKTIIYDHLLTFIVKLHSLDLYHNDFSLTNILVIPTSDGYEFSIVDLNRVRFEKITFRKGLGNFHKLEIPVEDMNKLIRAYAVRSGESPDAAVSLFWADTNRTMNLRRFRKRLRRYTLTPLENIIKGK
ncbi:lipopolysaccharide kinase InaA family protein [Dyadobacter sp. NIV53]|uniref:lipopolysaccharide kinase InaA family protein n=1 Tax=Dyadobacter sp. NIV53 TaxID=2861765 RepID=UPI001C87E770|nr:lipopolysaccharide kinase InaA family protein [Dyadobacter sp. NIV53]